MNSPNNTEVDSMDRIGPNRTKVFRMDRIRTKWTGYDQSWRNGLNRTNVDRIELKWTECDQCGPNRANVDRSGLNKAEWTEVERIELLWETRIDYCVDQKKLDINCYTKSSNMMCVSNCQYKFGVRLNGSAWIGGFIWRTILSIKL